MGLFSKKTNLEPAAEKPEVLSDETTPAQSTAPSVLDKEKADPTDSTHDAAASSPQSEVAEENAAEKKIESLEKQEETQEDEDKEWGEKSWPRFTKSQRTDEVSEPGMRAIT